MMEFKKLFSVILFKPWVNMNRHGHYHDGRLRLSTIFKIKNNYTKNKRKVITQEQEIDSRK